MKKRYSFDPDKVRDCIRLWIKLTKNDTIVPNRTRSWIFEKWLRSGDKICCFKPATQHSIGIFYYFFQKVDKSITKEQIEKYLNGSVIRVIKG